MGYEFTRAIVKKGVILLTPQQREVTGFSLWCQIERLPSNRSINLKYSRPKSWYGYVQRLIRGYVVESIPLEYENQLVYDFRNPFQEEAVADLCLFNALAIDLGGSFGTLLEAIGDLLDATTLIQVDGPGQVDSVIFNRMETDAFLVTLFDDTTAVFRVFGQEPPNPCDLDVGWAEPAGPPLPDTETPTTPSPAPNIPVNPKDPSGLDLPDEPYDRGSDDDGDSYDPPRPTDLPGATGTGPWRAVMDYLPRSSFPPFEVTGPAYQANIDIGNGSPNVSNPRITAYLAGPGGWNAVADGAFTNAVTGATVNFQLNGRIQPYDELTNITFQKV